MSLNFFNLDIEPTNRCNADCYFCPRDATPHQGLMTVEVFDQTLVREIELAEVARSAFGTHLKVNLCGLGEPLLNRHTPSFVAAVKDAGLSCSLSTNGSLLDEARTETLLEAGLDSIEINVGEQGEDYDRLYGLPWDKTCDRVTRFAELAGDGCAVRIVLVNHRRDQEHLNTMQAFWRARGITEFLPFEIMNRAGALSVDEMQYSSFPEYSGALDLLAERDLQPACGAPFALQFVGWDGQYYLCCSDWTKQVPLGSVFDTTFVAVTKQKMAHVLSREPICKQCNHDATNRVVEAMRGVAIDGLPASHLDDVLQQVEAGDAAAREIAEVMSSQPGALDAPRPRRLIPVASAD